VISKSTAAKILTLCGVPVVVTLLTGFIKFASSYDFSPSLSYTLNFFGFPLFFQAINGTYKAFIAQNFFFDCLFYFSILVIAFSVTRRLLWKMKTTPLETPSNRGIIVRGGTKKLLLNAGLGAIFVTVLTCVYPFYNAGLIPVPLVNISSVSFQFLLKAAGGTGFPLEYLNLSRPLPCQTDCTRYMFYATFARFDLANFALDFLVFFSILFCVLFAYHLYLASRIQRGVLQPRLST
jgi:hypothetical protein